MTAHAARGAHILASSKDYEDLILDVIFVHNDELKANPRSTSSSCAPSIAR